MRDWLRDWGISWRTVVWFQLIEAPFVPLLALGWMTLLSVELSAVIVPAVVVSVIRWVVSVAVLRGLLRPIDGWRESAPHADDTALLAASEALASAPTRFMRMLGGMWVIAFSGATAYVWFGMADTVPIGHAELLSVGLLLVALLFGAWSFAFSVTSMLLTNERVEIARALTERGLRGTYVHSSLSARLISLMLSYVVAAAALIAIAGVTNSAAFDRYQGASELARAGSHDLARVIAGLTPERSTIVQTDALPPVPRNAAVDELPELPGMRISLDRRSAHASVAIPIDRERWLLLDGPLKRSTAHYATMLLTFALVLAIWAPLTAVLTTRSLIDPLRHIEASMRRLVEVGDIREFEHLTIIQEDDLGALTRSFNRLVDNLRDLSDAASTVARGDLSITLDHPGDLPDAFRGMLEQLHAIVVELRATAIDVGTASAEIYAAAQSQESAAARSQASVSELSATVGSLAESAEHITIKANDVLDNAERTLVTTDAMVAKINELSTRTNGISDLLEVIREVAKRSDLLALNGSLEATRAGEAGRGFALVAAEMRRLAERVTGTVADVRVQIAAIKTSSTGTVMATEDNRKLANDTATAARQIFMVTQQQSADTSQVAQTMQMMTEFVVLASGSTTQTRAAAEGLRLRVEDLDRQTQQFQLRPREPAKTDV